MPQEKTEAHVLRGVDYGDTSRIVTFLTPGRGRMTCIAKGARRKNSPYGAALDTLNRLELVYYWKDGRSVQTLGEASLLDGYAGIKSDLERCAFSAFPLEVVAKVAHENEPSQVFYDALSRGLDCLSTWSGDARVHCCWQLALLLHAAGFEPVLDRCVHCARPAGDHPGFDLGGGVTCASCPSDRRLAAAEYAALRMLFSAREACPLSESVPGLFAVLSAYVVRQTEASYCSLRVLNEMFP